MRISPALLLLFACTAEVVPLGRSNYDHWVTTCAGGVNQQDAIAGRDECADALNVWAPEGRVETRPGYVGLVSNYISGASTFTQTLFYARAEDTSAGEGGFSSPSGAGVLTLSGLVGRVTTGGDMDRWYLGYSTTFNGVILVSNDPNANATTFKAEYYNGADWRYLAVTEISDSLSDGSVAQLSHLDNSGLVAFLFAAPQDWSTTTVNSQSAYWIRFNLLGANFSNPVTVDVDNTLTGIINSDEISGLFAVQFPTNKRYISINDFDADSVTYTNSSSIDLKNLFTARRDSVRVSGEPATIAVVPQFEEAFSAYNYDVVRHTTNSSAAAAVETADYAVGERGLDGTLPAPYAPSQMDTLSAFPQAKYISFFKGELWVANLFGSPYEVRWGAPAPYHKVFPTASYEILAEHDNSPITGMQPLGEFQVIYKRDSIWMAYDAGIDADGLQQYAIRQVVNGVGCVSNSSIKAIRGNHIFLAEDGVYSFNGQDVVKLSDNVQRTIDSINPGRRPFAAAAHWRTKGVYLLSFSTTGTNVHDTTLVFDYENAKWWIWEGIDAQHWLEDEGDYDAEAIYFGDSSGRIYRFGVGTDDHGGTIESYVITSKIGQRGDGQKRKCAGIEVCATNKTREVEVEVLVNDEESSTSSTLSMRETTEADWSNFSYNAGSATDDDWTHERGRARFVGFDRTFSWMQVKIYSDQKNQPMKFTYVDVSMRPLNRRVA